MTSSQLGVTAKREYWAFISYSHKDKAWADWLHKTLETYHLPAQWVGKETSEGELPKRLLPIFRDRDELPTAADLTSNIHTALDSAKCLIVICSPNAANSHWVNQEILAFKQMGKAHRIMGIIVDGEPNSGDERECFPPAMRFQCDAEGHLTSNPAEPIAADARSDKDGKANAKLKLIAGITGLPYDALRQRDFLRRRKRVQMVSGMIAILISLFTWLGAQVYFHNHARQLAATKALINTGKNHIEQGDIALGVAQIDAAVKMELEELKDYSMLNQFWIARLQPLAQSLMEIKQESVFWWQSNIYFLNADQKLLWLGDSNIVAWALTHKSRQLFVITELSASQWQVDIYNSETLQPLGNYPISKFQSDSIVIANPEGSDTLLLQAKTESSYLGGIESALLRLNTQEAELLLAPEVEFNSLYINRECSELLLESESATITVIKTVGNAPPQQYKYFNDPDYLTNWEKSFADQLQQQGFIFTKENGSQGQYFIQLDVNHKIVDHWFNPLDPSSESSLPEICDSPLKGQSLSLWGEADSLMQSPLQKLNFPNIIAESALWHSYPIDPTSRTNTSLPLLQEALRLANNDSKVMLDNIKINPSEHNALLGEIWSFAIAEKWRFDLWPSTVDKMTAQQLLLLAIDQHITEIPADDFYTLLWSNNPVSFIKHQDELWISADYIDGNSAFRGRIICQVDLKDRHFIQCQRDSAPLAEKSTSLAVGNLLVFATHKIMNYESFELFDTKSQQWVTPTQTPDSIKLEDIHLNSSSTRMVVLTESSLWSYSRDSVSDIFTLQSRYPLSSSSNSLTYPDDDKNLNLAVGATGLFSTDNEFIFFDSPTTINKIDLSTGISDWRTNLDTSNSVFKNNNMRLVSDNSNTYMLSFNSNGLQLFHQRTGMALSEYLDFEKLMENTDKLTIEADAISNISLAPNGVIRLLGKNFEWVRDLPDNVDQDIRIRTGREGDFGELLLIRLPSSVSQ